MTTQRSKNIDEERKNGESRYMTSEKKRYYLASADENIQMLINQQEEELTRVLIELKSQYDKLTKETTIKKRETDELDKKIAMLELMDSKTKKKFDEVNSNNENLHLLHDLPTFWKKQKRKCILLKPQKPFTKRCFPRFPIFSTSLRTKIFPATMKVLFPSILTGRWERVLQSACKILIPSPIQPFTDMQMLLKKALFIVNIFMPIT